jgi:hypothetical protein
MDALADVVAEGFRKLQVVVTFGRLSSYPTGHRVVQHGVYGLREFAA